MPEAKKKASRKTKKKTVVQVYNPKTQRWVKIDTATGRVTCKKTKGEYKNITKGKGKYYTTRQEGTCE